AASAARIFELLDTEPDVQDGPQTDHAIREIHGRVTFDDVTFRYIPDGPAVLDGVSFDIPAGTTLGVVGRTGSGKTTLVELIPRLMDETPGRGGLADGNYVRRMPVEVLRRGVGYVPQEVFLFSDAVGLNIAFGAMDAGEEAVRQAAREADLLENVEAFPEGFSTVVGERGIPPPGGQEQRAAI